MTDLATRLREGGRRGGVRSGAARREKRARYLRGELTGAELAEYEALLERNRAAASKGGKRSIKEERSK